MSTVLDELRNISQAQEVLGGNETEVQSLGVDGEVQSIDNIDLNAFQSEENIGDNTTKESEIPKDTKSEKPEMGTGNVVFASDEVAELNAFLAKNPGKGVSDWQSLKRPTSEMDKQELLRAYYSEKENMTENEIAYRLSQMEVDEDGDDDFSDMDDGERLKRLALMDGELRKATEWRESYVAEQLKYEATPQDHVSAPASYTVEEIHNQWQKELEAKNKRYLETIYGALPSIKSIDMEVGGEKMAYVPDEAFMSDLKAVSERPDLLWDSMQADTGGIKDPVGWLELLAWGNKSTRDKLIAFREEQAILRDRIERSRSQRNVTEDMNMGSVAHDSSDGAFENWYAEKRKSKF